MFSIDATDLHWMDGVPAKEDRCLHGHATARIGTETFKYDATVSATALYLLKSLKKDHKIYESNQMLGVILLTEYHASSIRLWRVILLRSDIRLTPSDIRYASLSGE